MGFCGFNLIWWFRWSRRWQVVVLWCKAINQTLPWIGPVDSEQIGGVLQLLAARGLQNGAYIACHVKWKAAGKCVAFLHGLGHPFLCAYIFCFTLVLGCPLYGSAAGGLACWLMGLLEFGFCGCFYVVIVPLFAPCRPGCCVCVSLFAEPSRGPLVDILQEQRTCIPFIVRRAGYDEHPCVFQPTPNEALPFDW